MENETRFLYVLHSEVADRYYVGVSSNPELRLQRHSTAMAASIALRAHSSLALAYQAEFCNSL